LPVPGAVFKTKMAGQKRAAARAGWILDLFRQFASYETAALELM
jgi:hypothetical protein